MTETVDAIGLLCPLPVLKLRKRLGQVGVGCAVTLLTDDAAALIDVQHFCHEAGHQLIASETDQAPYRFTVARAG